MKKKWIMTAAVLVMMLLVGTGCSGQSGGTETAETDKPVEI